MNLWTPPAEWTGQDAILIGGGPSLRDFDFSRIQGMNVIGCNDAFRLGPAVVKYCAFGDASFFYRQKWDMEKSLVRFVTCAPLLKTIKFPNIYLMNRQLDGIHAGSDIGWNQSTGGLAINLAISLGATRIFLLGYDMNNIAGHSHWHDHNTNPTKEYSFQRFLRGFQRIKSSLPEGVEVFNVTDGSSRLETFPKVTRSTFFEMIQKEVLA